MIEADGKVKKVLHVGCGSATIAKMPRGFQEGWQEVRFDINPDVKPDLVGTITDMRAVANNSVEAVYSSHNIEHVYAHQVTSVLKEFHRVLKPDGFAVVTCPDAESVAKVVAEGKLTEPLYVSPSGPISPLDILYGHGAAIANGEEYMAHRTAFTSSSLLAEMEKAGFGTVGIRRRLHRWDIWALGTRMAVSDAVARKMLALYFPA